MRKLVFALAGAAALAIGGAANATITISATPGTDPYSGPTPTYDFESPAPVSGGLVTNTSVPGVSAQPFGSTGNFWTVSPIDGTPGLLDLSAWGDIFNISFIWGSVDAFNTLEVLGAGDVVLATFTGADVAIPPTGNQTDPAENPLVTLLFTGADISAVTGLRLSSTSPAFETDNFAINAIPEPATWGMLLLGFAAVGYHMRKRRPKVTMQLA